MRSTLIALSLLLAGAAHAAPAAKAYATAGDCDVFPAVALATAPGLCMGIEFA